MNFWQQILNYMQTRVSQESFDNWLKATGVAGVDGDALLVSTPDRETKKWLETEYSQLIRHAIGELKLPLGHVSFEIQTPNGTKNQALAAVDSTGDGEARL